MDRYALKKGARLYVSHVARFSSDTRQTRKVRLPKVQMTSSVYSGKSHIGPRIIKPRVCVRLYARLIADGYDFGRYTRGVFSTRANEASEKWHENYSCDVGNWILR